MRESKSAYIRRLYALSERCGLAGSKNRKVVRAPSLAKPDAATLRAYIHAHSPVMQLCSPGMQRVQEPSSKDAHSAVSNRQAHSMGAPVNNEELRPEIATTTGSETPDLVLWHGPNLHKGVLHPAGRGRGRSKYPIVLHAVEHSTFFKARSQPARSLLAAQQAA